MDTPPKIVDSRGRTIKPGQSDSTIDRILAEGPPSRPLLPRRTLLMFITIITMAIVAVGVGLTGTDIVSDGPGGPAATDSAVRDLTAYADAANDRQAPFPPDAGGTIVATLVEDNLYRVTSRGFDGRCWQVLAYTITDPQRPGVPLLDLMETVPYTVEPIHCRLNR